ncbi:MAG: hypothetical protein CMJ78_04420 [Planctomycetaceae bacterium]|nr:hypothetical protein [Planctomycetaceae bacterium]
MASSKSESLHIGFMTALGIPERNFVAGLLITNRFGRPLEFQCTTPIKPNRTQEILYGPTLVPFILGELISKALIQKVSIKPTLVVTDHLEIHELRNHVDVPVICLAESDDDSNKADPLMGVGEVTRIGQLINNEDQTEASETSVTVGQHVFAVHPEHISDWQLVSESLRLLNHCEPDFVEPLERVREALAETVNLAAA